MELELKVLFEVRWIHTRKNNQFNWLATDQLGRWRIDSRVLSCWAVRLQCALELALNLPALAQTKEDMQIRQPGPELPPSPARAAPPPARVSAAGCGVFPELPESVPYAPPAGVSRSSEGFLLEAA